MNDSVNIMPSGYVGVDLFGGDGRSALNVCVVVCSDPEPGVGRFVRLREELDARVLLGCVTDAGGVVREWVQVWIQSMELVAGSIPAHRESLTNHDLERRWRETADAVERVFPNDPIRCGFERDMARAMFYDTAKKQIVEAVHEESGSVFELCRDDDLLRDFGLPGFTTTSHRYLYVPSLNHQSPLVAVSSESPTTGAVLPLDELLTGLNRNLVPLNPGAGLMMVRRHSPLTYNGYVDLLAGADESGSGVVSHGTRTFPLRRSGSEASVEGGEGVDADRLFLGRHGRWGRLVEALHLKLRILSDCVAGVEAFTREAKRPVLGLTDESFHIELWDRACGLPRMWTAKAVLNDAGGAVALPVGESDREYFVSPHGLGRGIYRPQTAMHAEDGRCALRIRRVDELDDGQVVVEGTLETEGRLGASVNDLIELRMSVDDRRLRLFASIERDRAMARGEMRFRSVPHRFSRAEVDGLRANEGVPMRDVSFEVLPLLSTPCDLYALGVLGVRSLLVNHENTLPIALDETLSLCRQLADNLGSNEASSAPPIQDRIAMIFDVDDRWSEQLGPHRLTRERLTPQEGFDLVPADLWFRVLGVLVQMFPGMGPDSLCRDLGDVSRAGLSRVFAEPRSQLEQLLVRTRSLVVIDWRYNREVHAVIRGYRTGMIKQGLASV